MRWLRRVGACCLALAAGMAAATGAAQPPLVLGAAGRYDLGPHLLVLDDPGSGRTLQEVQQPDVRARFSAVPENNLGLRSAAVWLRVPLRRSPEADPHWLLEIAYPPLDHVEVFVPNAAGGWQRLPAGDHEPPDSRLLPHRNYVLPVDLPPGDSELYVHLRTVGTMTFPLTLWRPEALWQHDQVGYTLLALYFGLAVGLALYNLLLFVAVRDVAYLVYVAFVASMATAQAALNGLGRQFLWPDAAWWIGAAPNLSLAAAVICGLLFVRRFLETRYAMPRLDRLLLALAVAWVLVALGSDVLLPYAASVQLIPVLAAPTVGLLVAVGVVAWRRGQAGARAYLAACTALLAGAVGLFLHDMGVLPSNGLTANAMLIGAGVEMVLLSFALAGRINVARRFKEQARLRLAAEHALVESLGEAQRQLRSALQEREGLLENALVGIAFVSPQGRLTWANRALQEMFGAARGEARSLERFYLSREQYLEVGGEAAAVLARGGVYRRDVELQRLDGSRLWVRLSSRAVREYDRTQGTAWVLVDISREKELEARLAVLQGAGGEGAGLASEEPAGG